MVAFGQIVLPIAALIAVGLLFAGVKLFFLAPPNRPGVEVIAGTESSPEEKKVSQDLAGNPAIPSEQAVVAASAVKPDVRKPQQQRQNVVLAGPIDPAKPAKSVKPVKKESQSGVAKSAATKPSAPAKPSSTINTASNAKPVQTAAKPAVRWGVQIGAFTKEEGAKTISEQAKKDGYATTISAGDSSAGSKFYRVRVSAGDTRETAERLAGELEKKGYPVQILQM